MAVPYLAAGIGVGLSKRAENRRRQAVANAYSKKYPLVDNSASMAISIDNAVKELRSIEQTPAESQAARRVKRRNTDLLRKWLIVMKEHQKDLQSGINVASTQVAQPSVPLATVTATETTPEKAVLPQVPQSTLVRGVAEISEIRPETDVQNAGNLAAPTKEKGVNWLVIAGVAVAVYLGYKLIKK